MTFTNQRLGMWDEETMRDVLPEAVERRNGAAAGLLRSEVLVRNSARAEGLLHEVTRGRAVVFAPEGNAHGNFITASYKRICADPEWARRLSKVHTGRRQARPTGEREEVRVWRELDTAASSDALLMNVFCYPRVLGRGLCALLGVRAGVRPEFGYKPRVPLLRGLVDAAEIDMLLDGLMVEAKLTEGDFQRAPMRLVQRYLGFEDAFDTARLEVGRGGVKSYQLIRGVMAAWASGERYCVLCDARRPDLMDAWFAVMNAVRSCEVRGRLRLVTWQEVARVVPGPLRTFLAEKYGIAG